MDYGLSSSNLQVVRMEEIPSCEVMTPNHTQKESKITVLVVISSVIASLGGILLGYDMGIITTANLQLRVRFTLTCLEEEIVVSSVVLGAFVGSLVAGSVVDRFGRRRSILGTSVLFVCGSIFLASSQDLTMLIIGRLVVGFGVALSTAAECTYISEISPKRWRGLLVSLNELGITVGFLLAYVVGHCFIENPNGWRYMFGIASIPGLFQLVGVSCLPPSPHFLILRGNPIKAEVILKRIHPDCDPQIAVEEITTAVLDAKCSSMWQMFGRKDNMRGRMIIGIALALLQQLTGNTNVLYYAPIIFQQFGYCSDSASTLATISLGVVKVISAILALAVIDKFGRRALLSTGALVMGLSVALLGIVTVATNVVPPADRCSSHAISSSNETLTTDSFTTGFPFNATDFPFNGTIPSGLLNEYLINSNDSEGYFVSVTPPVDGFVANDSDGFQTTTTEATTVGLGTTTMEATTVGFGTTTMETSSFTPDPNNCQGTSGPRWIRIVSIVALMTYISAYQFSFGIGTWLVLSEIFPTKFRGRCVGISTSATWGANVILAVTFLDSIDKMGIGYTMIMYAAVSIFSFFFILFFLPETKQKSLEEISSSLSHGLRCQVGCTSRPATQSRLAQLGHPRLKRQGTKGPGIVPIPPDTPPTRAVSQRASRTNGVFRTLDED